MNKNFTPVPINLRKLENLHILLWLVKDVSWCMLWKQLGMFMIIPTFITAIYITIKFSKTTEEIFHNVAVVFWIVANGYWMTAEFFKFETQYCYKTITYKELAIIPFTVGLVTLGYYYLIWLPFKSNKTQD